MAVTKIRKISSWTLLVCSIITIVVLGVVFFGGVVDPSADNKEYVYTDLLLNWGYIIFALAAISTLCFAVWQFIGTLKIDPKGALLGLGAIILFGVLLLISYSIGDETAMPLINADSERFNVPYWLKVTDMWLYSTYVLLVLIILAVVAGTVKKVLSR